MTRRREASVTPGEASMAPGAARRVPATQRDADREHEPLPTHFQDLPALPPEYDVVVQGGLRDLGIPELGPTARAAIDGHVRLLLAWNGSINLTAIRSPGDVAREHVLDSLSAVPLLRRLGPRRVLDLGSGGGYPGIPLAVALGLDRMLLVESVGKKAAFLATAANAIGAGDGIGVAATRAERLAADRHHRGRWDVVVARAVAALPELVELGLPLLVEGGHLVAWKREPLEAELATSEGALAAVGGTVYAIEGVPVDGLEDHRLVVIEKTAPTPARFPRDPAVRKRQRL